VSFRIARYGLPCFVAWLACGCATITTGSGQAVNVITEPEGAACIFRRDGAVIGIVNPTPGSLSITKSHTAIDVDCRKEGFLDAIGSVGKQFQPMTFGNIILGGLIGVIVDVASGATAQYEPTVSIRLTPAEFDDQQARDRFFDQQKATLVAQTKLVRERIANACRSTDCDAQLRLANEEEQRALARIESMRKSARIKSSQEESK
jgi:hypothetical protein